MRVKEMRFVSCEACQRTIRHRYYVRPIGFSSQLLMTVVTCGCWIPLWLMLLVLPKERTNLICTNCGEGEEEAEAMADGFLQWRKMSLYDRGAETVQRINSGVERFAYLIGYSGATKELKEYLRKPHQLAAKSGAVDQEAEAAGCKGV